MTQMPPQEALEDPQEFISYLKGQYSDDKEGLGEYLELLYEDYYNDNLTDSNRYYEMEEKEVDIGTFIDLAVIFGFVWERDDPSDEHKESNE